MPRPYLPLFLILHTISIHKALASLDGIKNTPLARTLHFNPQGSREPRRYKKYAPCQDAPFQSTRLSRASTVPGFLGCYHRRYFNPQGSREPRQEELSSGVIKSGFQSTRLSRASTFRKGKKIYTRLISIHKALASLDFIQDIIYYLLLISIHKALASLDIRVPIKPGRMSDFNPQGSREPRRQKCTIILASMPHLHASYYTSSTNRFSS